MRVKRSHLALFLLGLFSQTQINVVGMIGIAELFVFVSAPFLFITDFSKLKRDGFSTLLLLAFLGGVGCLISSFCNHTHPQLMYRGLAQAYSLFAIPVVFQHFLREDLEGIKQYFIGFAISCIITIYGFRSGVEISALNRVAGVEINDLELFFSGHLGALFTLPLFIFYLRWPTSWTLLLALVPTLYTVIHTSTGRSSVFLNMISILMLIYVGRKVSRIHRLQHHFWSIVICGFLAAAATSAAYRQLALHGLLNERSQRKYESQTKEGGGAVKLLMAGRADFFIGLGAALDNPIWGFGPWPRDTGGYTERFLAKYGSAESAREFVKDMQERAKYGVYEVGLGAHSMLIGNWIDYGILGLPFWLYVLYLHYVFMRKYMAAIPQLYGYFAMNLPGMIWGILFSPYSNRMAVCSYLTLLMMAIAVGKGKIQLPPKMLEEARRCW